MNREANGARMEGSMVLEWRIMKETRKLMTEGSSLVRSDEEEGGRVGVIGMLEVRGGKLDCDGARLPQLDEEASQLDEEEGEGD